ncbi:MAG: PD-(D/E)XK motif protein [Prevotella sp.]|jgi:hypothetical protein|nr:PD-(D/E)XK motif protein [Prevotella sp.]
MKNDIYKIFAGDFRPGSYIRLGENKNLSLYLGKDDSGNYAFEFRGRYNPIKISSSDVILVAQFKGEDTYTLRFSLDNKELLEYFCTFCEDLFESTKNITEDSIAYKQLNERYFSWKKLFRPHTGSMSDSEIVGLLGELLFMDERMIPECGVPVALNSWTGPEKTHKDFSTDNVWYEIKTISSGKNTVKISSLEQLDSEIKGYLIVYDLEKMSPSFNGLKLNQLVQKLLYKMAPSYREEFITKLSLYNYDFSPNYDDFVYSVVGCSTYEVKDNFPRLNRKNIPTGIDKVQYEINLSDIENYKL